ncbi:MAG: hypothetical protein PHE73_07980 [Sulfurovaceae bacterium]|nr:hypothetical protein [Sulfurovaceae bacterium]
MKRFKKLFVGLVLVFGFNGCEAKTQTLPPKAPLDVSRLGNVYESVYNKYSFGSLNCIVGKKILDDGISERAFIKVVDKSIAIKNWNKELDLPESYFFQNRATHCAFFDDNIYVLEQVDTQSSQSLSQTLLYVCKFNKNGENKMCKIVENNFYTSWVELEKKNFNVSNDSIEIHGKFKNRNSDNIEDFDTKMKLF